MIHTPLHPGIIVKEVCIESTGMTVGTVAEKLGIDRTTLSRLINGHAGISPDMAVRLSIALNTSPVMWMNLQRDYDLHNAVKNKRKLRVHRIKSAA